MEHNKLGSINNLVLNPVSFPKTGWTVCLLISLTFLLMGGYAWTYQVKHGLEWSGISHPIAWGVYITNFVFWIGIAHAGTLISAILFLLRAQFRISISRISEAMTVFAIVVAGFFPIIHLGRALYAFWIIPYPNQRELWVNFKSPLVWDAFAIATYLIVSVSFFYLGLIPDLASKRDESSGYKRRILGLFAFGFRGLNSQWFRYSRAYMLLAAISTPLVISVHSIVSWDFAVSVLPGWHSTLFAPYFVAGAIFSGCALVAIIAVILRKTLVSAEKLIQTDHLQSLAKIILFTSQIIALSYLLEGFGAFYADDHYEQSLFLEKALGEGKMLFWIMFTLNCIFPQLLWSLKIRNNERFLLWISIGIVLGMWIERFIIVTSSLAGNFNNFTWGEYHFEWVEIWITAGSVGLFSTLLLVFLRILPIISISDTNQKRFE